MPADRRDLEARLAAATAGDTVRGLVFNAAFSVAREHAGPDAARACDPAGLGSRTDFFSYPVGDYLETAWNAVDRVEGALGGVEAGFFRLGRRTVETVFSSMLGRTLLAIAGQEPRRLVSSAPSAYLATVSYGERSVEWLGERRARLVFRRDFLVPPYHCGVVTAALEALGARDARCIGTATAFLEATYELSWE